MNKPPVLKINARHSHVRRLQMLLNNASSPGPGLIVDGHFGPNTAKAVRDFQRQAGLVVDGVVGPRTWSALVQGHSSKETQTARTPVSKDPQGKLAEIAATYIGARETGNNRAGDNEQMKEIFRADDLVIDGKTDGYPWCAAFVSLCVQKLCRQSAYYVGLTPPREPAVERFLTIWAEDNGCLIFKPDNTTIKPIKGDIVVFTFSHIGIVESSEDGAVKTIEGNTNAAGSREGVIVARKRRNLSLVRAFIRLPVTELGILDAVRDYSRVV